MCNSTGTVLGIPTLRDSGVHTDEYLPVRNPACNILIIFRKLVAAVEREFYCKKILIRLIPVLMFTLRLISLACSC